METDGWQGPERPRPAGMAWERYRQLFWGRWRGWLLANYLEEQEGDLGGIWSVPPGPSDCLPPPIWSSYCTSPTSSHMVAVFAVVSTLLTLFYLLDLKPLQVKRYFSPTERLPHSRWPSVVPSHSPGTCQFSVPFPSAPSARSASDRFEIEILLIPGVPGSRLLPLGTPTRVFFFFFPQTLINLPNIHLAHEAK